MTLRDKGYEYERFLDSFWLSHFACTYCELSSWSTLSIVPIFGQGILIMYKVSGAGVGRSVSRHIEVKSFAWELHADGRWTDRIRICIGWFDDAFE